jgi:hypothetical protein
LLLSPAFLGAGRSFSVSFEIFSLLFEFRALIDTFGWTAAPLA